MNIVIPQLPHYVSHRLDASHEAALKYMSQFPSRTAASVARFVAFVTGSFTALLLLVSAGNTTQLNGAQLQRQIRQGVSDAVDAIPALSSQVPDTSI